MAARNLEFRGNLESAYADAYTPEAIAALEALAGLDADRKALMTARIERRRARARNKQSIDFLDPEAAIGRTNIKVKDARAGNFVGAAAQGSDDVVDLEPLIRDALLLELPAVPLCRPDCQGLCPRCGVDHNLTSCDCVDAEPDPRWAALRALDL